MLKLPLKMTEAHPDDSLCRDYKLRWDVHDATGLYVFSAMVKEEVEEIVRAVNSHEALVKALGDSLEMIGEALDVGRIATPRITAIRSILFQATESV